MSKRIDDFLIKYQRRKGTSSPLSEKWFESILGDGWSTGIILDCINEGIEIFPAVSDMIKEMGSSNKVINFSFILAMGKILREEKKKNGDVKKYFNMEDEDWSNLARFYSFVPMLETHIEYGQAGLLVSLHGTKVAKKMMISSFIFLEVIEEEERKKWLAKKLYRDILSCENDLITQSVILKHWESKLGGSKEDKDIRKILSLNLGGNLIVEDNESSFRILDLNMLKVEDILKQANKNKGIDIHRIGGMVIDIIDEYERKLMLNNNLTQEDSGIVTKKIKAGSALRIFVSKEIDCEMFSKYLNSVLTNVDYLLNLNNRKVFLEKFLFKETLGNEIKENGLEKEKIISNKKKI